MWSHSFWFPHQITTCTSLLPHTRYRTRPNHPPWCLHSHTWWEAQIMKLLVHTIFSTSRDIHWPRFEYSPQYPQSLAGQRSVSLTEQRSITDADGLELTDRHVELLSANPAKQINENHAVHQKNRHQTRREHITSAKIASLKENQSYHVIMNAA